MLRGFHLQTPQSRTAEVLPQILAMDPNPDIPTTQPSPGLFRYVLGFLLVGAAWGLTTPFMRRAAVSSSASSTPESRAWLEHPNTPWLKAKVWGVLYAVWDVLKNPAYAVPFLINLVSFIFSYELSLTVPITNSLSFLFTVLGEWWAEKKVITRGMFYTWVGMALVLGGIGFCHHIYLDNKSSSDTIQQSHMPVFAASHYASSPNDYPTSSSFYHKHPPHIPSQFPQSHSSLDDTHSTPTSSIGRAKQYKCPRLQCRLRVFLIQRVDDYPHGIPITLRMDDMAGAKKNNNHYRGILIPAQQGVLSIPRLSIFDVSPSFEEVFMLHDTSKFTSDGAVDGFVDCKVCGEQNIEETLVDLWIFISVK
ncbi:hypothetical protein KCU91_g32, partial [Aureobasidium melanogenum]